MAQLAQPRWSTPDQWDHTAAASVFEDDPSAVAAADQAVWLLGKRYAGDEERWRADFASLVWCSYRRDFAQMKPYSYTSDSGWGCMLRASQMMMAQTLKIHNLGRNWQLPAELEQRRQCPEYCDLLQWFLDQPGEHCLFSIHNMVQLGQQYDKLPGEWYGPGTASLVLRDLATVQQHCLDGNLAVQVAQGDCVYVDEVEALCCLHRTFADDAEPSPSTTAGSAAAAEEADPTGGNGATSASQSTTPQPPPPPRTEQSAAGQDNGGGGSHDGGGGGSGGFYDPLLNVDPTTTVPQTPAAQSSTAPQDPWSTALLLVVPLRLGLEKLNPEYHPSLLQCLQMPQSVGILGGRPNHAIYFAGHCGDVLHGLDPHTTQPTPKLDESFPSDAHLRSMQAATPVKMRVGRLDPSLALGFYCRDRTDFSDLCARIHALEESCPAVPFSVASQSPDFEGAGALSDSLSEGESGGESDVEDEYVLI